jgi:hypothetical protein
VENSENDDEEDKGKHPMEHTQTERHKPPVGPLVAEYDK